MGLSSQQAANHTGNINLHNIDCSGPGLIFCYMKKIVTVKLRIELIICILISRQGKMRTWSGAAIFVLADKSLNSCLLALFKHIFFLLNIRDIKQL